MFERIECDLTGQIHGLIGAVFRYEVLGRLRKASARLGVNAISFGFSRNELRLVLEGDSESIRNVLRGLKTGTTRSARKWNICLRANGSERIKISRSELIDAIVWTHLGPVSDGAAGPLANPWSSHRDLMGFREASFFDATRLRELAEPRTVHKLAGGAALPIGWPPAETGLEDLSFLLRVSGGVLGVLPADRRCFKLFVHLARARGWGNAEIAPALALTARRVRQLASGEEPRLHLALCAVGDHRLMQVP